jgi:hypothetical protein
MYDRTLPPKRQAFADGPDSGDSDQQNHAVRSTTRNRDHSPMRIAEDAGIRGDCE